MDVSGARLLCASQADVTGMFSTTFVVLDMSVPLSHLARTTGAAHCMLLIKAEGYAP